MKDINIKNTDASSQLTYEWSDYIDAILATGSTQTVTVPANATRVSFAATGNFYVKFSSVGPIATFGAITAGTLYTPGAYAGVALTGGTGSGATADITVGGGGGVTVVTLVNAGTGYTVGDVLSAAAANIGGTGSGFSIPVATIVGAAIPGASVTNGTASALNPTTRPLNGLTSFSVIAASGVVISLSWYNGQG
jgi:hypothetical protein